MKRTRLQLSIPALLGVLLLGLPGAPLAQAEPTDAARAVGDVRGVDHMVWLDAGGLGRWFTDRAPIVDQTPLVVGLGYAATRRRARFSWRLDLYADPGEPAPRFIYGDLLSIDRLLVDGPLQPWWRIAFGFGLDLVGTGANLGANGYFNAANGATAGMGLTHAWGVDWTIGDLVLRAEVGARAYGGAGRTQVMAMGQLGIGYVFRGPPEPPSKRSDDGP